MDTLAGILAPEDFEAVVSALAPMLGDAGGLGALDSSEANALISEAIIQASIATAEQIIRAN